jgi:hypothetical protein
LHSHLVRERPKTIAELYEEFTKLSKSKVLHFLKLEQQICYNDSQRSYPNQVCSTKSVDCKAFGKLRKEF